MFGYVRASAEELSEEEKQRYRSVYCGLCRALGRQHGVFARLSLTYDMTFLILFLSSLYEPAEQNDKRRCAVHPFTRTAFSVSEITGYAADMTVALMYQKCLDDWKDEHKLTRRGYAEILKADYQQVQAKWPGQAAAIERCMEEISAIEADPISGPDAGANSFGTMLGQIFLFREDNWGNLVRRFGYGLGRFIYTMDAVMDREEDQKHGNFNPVLLMERTAEEMREPLMLQIGQAADAFERLPLVQDLHLLRNILYSGVWQSYNSLLREKTGADKNDK